MQYYVKKRQNNNEGLCLGLKETLQLYVEDDAYSAPHFMFSYYNTGTTTDDSNRHQRLRGQEKLCEFAACGQILMSLKLM